MSLEHGLIYHESTYDTAIKVVESESDIRITTVTLDFALMGELWGVCCEDLWENFPCYNAGLGFRQSETVKDVP